VKNLNLKNKLHLNHMNVIMLLLLVFISILNPCFLFIHFNKLFLDLLVKAKTKKIQKNNILLLLILHIQKFCVDIFCIILLLLIKNSKHLFFRKKRNRRILKILSHYHRSIESKIKNRSNDIYRKTLSNPYFEYLFT